MTRVAVVVAASVLAGLSTLTSFVLAIALAGVSPLGGFAVLTNLATLAALSMLAIALVATAPRGDGE